MNIALWVVAIAAAAIFFSASANKLRQPKAELVKMENMGWANDFSEANIKRIGAIELVGVVGLIAPQALNNTEILTPIAAVCLLLMMVAASIVHIRRGEIKLLTFTVPLILALAYVAIGRFING